MRRLRDALAEVGGPDAPGPMDLATLVRHVLWSMRTGDAPVGTWLPAGDDWPAARHYAEAKLSATPEGKGLRIYLDRWHPSWLQLHGVEPGAAAASQAERRPRPLNLPADPFFAATLGLDAYSAPGQREAVRALALAPDGGTVIANLPTGTGKSAVAYSTAILRSQARPMVALVVVPTTALALDQDRAFRQAASNTNAVWCPDVLAYHRSLPESAKSDLRSRIRNGSQVIVFASPESILGGLRAAIFDAASRGLISLLAVDEAHVAVAWGEDFRPDFQFIAPLRDQLLERQRSCAGSGFPTLLMSGTLTATALDRLTADFGRASAVEVVSAAALRPEPEYWIAEVSNVEERERRVLEALARLPRPAILYTTRPVHADAWRQRLTLLGYKRLAVVHGGTPDQDRRRAMEGMRGSTIVSSDRRSTIDLVIGTSAYGLGVDHPDVRTIIHACVPESLDRFYQEVGRAGRDGAAAVSIVIPADEDRGTAEHLSRDTIIGIEKAKERWRAMRRTSEAVPGGGRRMKLGQVPAYLFQESETNEAWNLRTLLLLRQAGILEMRLEEPPSRAPEEADDEWDERVTAAWEQQRTTRVIDQVLVEAEEGAGFWDSAERARETALTRGKAGFEAMLAAIESTHEFSRLFSAEYRVEQGQVRSVPALEVPVARACGGCPACRSAGRHPSAGFVPIPAAPSIADPLDEVAGRYFSAAGAEMILVSVDDPRDRRSKRHIRDAVASLVSHGLGSLVADPRLIAELRPTISRRAVLTATKWEPTSLPSITTALIATELEELAAQLVRALQHGPRRFIFVDSKTPDPDWRYQALSARGGVISIRELLSVL